MAEQVSTTNHHWYMSHLHTWSAIISSKYQRSLRWYLLLQIYSRLSLTSPKATTRYSPAISRQSPAKRSEEHTSELQSLMRLTYSVFYLEKKTNHIVRPQ